MFGVVVVFMHNWRFFLMHDYWWWCWWMLSRRLDSNHLWLVGDQTIMHRLWHIRWSSLNDRRIKRPALGNHKVFGDIRAHFESFTFFVVNME
jgi:hypothetical protein